MAWAAQAAELHTHHADWENRRKEGRGFYKLSDETVAAVREDLTKYYQQLVEQHSEELAHLLRESQEDLLDRLIEIRDAQRHAEPVAEPGSTEQVGGQPNIQKATNVHESA